MKVILALALLFGAEAFVPTSTLSGARVAPRAAARNAVEMGTPMGINGFGRIGRLVARIMAKSPDCDLKLINTGASCEYMAYQMKYDSIHGRYDGTIEADGDFLIVDGTKIPCSHTRDPAEIPFAQYGADYVCESTGAFLTGEKVEAHFDAGQGRLADGRDGRQRGRVRPRVEGGLVRVVHD